MEHIGVERDVDREVTTVVPTTDGKLTDNHRQQFHSPGVSDTVRRQSVDRSKCSTPIDLGLINDHLRSGSTLVVVGPLHLYARISNPLLINNPR